MARSFVSLLCALGCLGLSCAASESEGPGSAGSGAGTGTGATGAWGGGGSPSGGTGGAAAAGGSSGTGAGASAGTGGSGGRKCASDLQSVVDDAGNVIEKCAPDKGCFEGNCVAACDAAIQTKGNVGCSFIAPTPPFTGAGWPGSQGASLLGPCHAVFIANAWNRHAKLTLDYGSQKLDVAAVARIPKGNIPYPTYQPLPAQGLPPGEVAILFLSHDPQANNAGIPLQCPVKPAILMDTAVTTSGRGTAFRLGSDTPITAYDIVPYGGARTFSPSASLLLPVSAWGTSHMAVAPHDIDPNPTVGGNLWITLVGSSANTSVTITPKAQLPAGLNVPVANANQATSVSLGAGETIQWLMGDPTGAAIKSTAPIGVFTGNTQLWVTAGESIDGGKEPAHQQLPPVSALGSEYVGAGNVTRMANLSPETIMYRVMGVVDGTALSWDPAPPSGAPSSLSAGQVAEFTTKAPFSVRSQDKSHAFYLTQYMTGSVFAAVMRQDGTQPLPIGVSLNCGIGDEEWIYVLPPAQFLRRYVFFTDPTYATTNLVITRKKSGAGGFQDVYVACIGKVSGFAPVGSAGEFEVAHVDLVRGMKAQGSCVSSRHEAWSDGEFGVTVWGTDWCASYAYPAGGSLQSINLVSLD